jgi:hypothetical protein
MPCLTELSLVLRVQNSRLAEKIYLAFSLLLRSRGRPLLEQKISRQPFACNWFLRGERWFARGECRGATIKVMQRWIAVVS